MFFYFTFLYRSRPVLNKCLDNYAEKPEFLFCRFHFTVLKHLILPYFDNKLAFIFPSHNLMSLEALVCL